LQGNNPQFPIDILVAMGIELLSGNFYQHNTQKPLAHTLMREFPLLK
jgi:hypothetical protein